MVESPMRDTYAREPWGGHWYVREEDYRRLVLDLAAAERGHDSAHAACVQYEDKVERLREALRRICSMAEGGAKTRDVWEIARDALAVSWQDRPADEATGAT
jgi:hypothetical protein